MRSIYGKIIAIAMFCAILLSCANYEIRPETQPPGTLRARISIRDSAFALGSEIEFSLIVKPVSHRNAEVVFANGCKADFLVLRDGQPVWNALHNISCTQMIIRDEIHAGDSLVFKSVWSGDNLGDKPIGPGEYEVEGLLLTTPSLKTARVKFHLVD